MSRKTMNDNSSTIEKLKNYKKVAYAEIDEAMKLDGQGFYDASLKKYLSGMEHMAFGLALEIKGEGPEVEKARVSQEKMAANADLIKSRIPEIRKKLQEEGARLANGRKPQTRSGVQLQTPPPASSISSGGATSTSSPSSAFTFSTVLNYLPSFQKQPEIKATPTESRSPDTMPTTTTAKKEVDDKTMKKGHMANIDRALANRVLNEIVDKESSPVSFDDIVGMDNVKSALRDFVVLPAMRPELFTGIRAPPKGLLLFGPPGNGKSFLAKAVAHEAKATFFNVSAGLLVSKYLGEGEKMVQALFAMAKELQPAIIFIDEMDSVLTKRSGGEHEATRRIKTELLICMDGVGSSAEDRVMVIGATNLPQELDEAVLRRLPKRIYIPLPDNEMRSAIIMRNISKITYQLSKSDMKEIVALTEGYSASDLTAMVREASFAPLRELGDALLKVKTSDIRPLQLIDFKNSIKSIRASVSPESLAFYDKWNREFGATS